VWDPKEYGNITDVRIPPHRIWKPDILIYNSVDAEFDGTYQTPTVVRSTGDITYIPPGVHATNCRMLYVNFPFDHHRCSIKFGSWAAHGSMVRMAWKHCVGLPAIRLQNCIHSEHRSICNLKKIRTRWTYPVSYHI